MMRLTQQIGLLILPIILITGSCSNSKLTTLKGNITNLDGNIIELITSDTAIQISVDTSGFFTGSFELKEASYINMSYSGRFNTLFLEPGDDLTMSFDPDKMPESITYKGKGEVANKYMNLIRLERNKLPTNDELMVLGEQDFLNQLDESFKKLKDLLTLNESQLNSQFYNTELAKIEYSKAEMLIRYPSYHQYLIQKNDFNVSPEYYSLIDQYELNHPEYIGLFQFDNFIYGIIQQKVEQSKLGNTEMNFKKSFEVVNNLITDPLVRNLGYSGIFYNFLSSGISYSQAKPLYDQYGADLSPQDKEAFNEILTRLQNIEPGNPSPKFKFASMYGDLVSLDVLKDKPLFLTVWSSIEPNYQDDMDKIYELQQNYGDKIQFVYVSVEDYFEDWQLRTREMNIPDIQLFATDGWSDPFLHQYVIEKLPRFILIDQDGKIKNAFVQHEKAASDIEEIVSQLSI